MGHHYWFRHRSKAIGIDLRWLPLVTVEVSLSNVRGLLTLVPIGAKSFELGRVSGRVSLSNYNVCPP